MRELKIREIDNGSYIVETIDFFDNDVVEYHHDNTTKNFYAEYKRPTTERRQFEREYFPWEEAPNLGEAINFIMARERYQCGQRYHPRPSQYQHSSSVY